MADPRAPRLALGACGSGKGWTLARHARRARDAGWCVLVLDPNGEWPENGFGGGSYEWARCDGPASAASLLRNPRLSLIAVRPKKAAESSSAAPLAAIADELAAAAVGSGRPVLLILPEVQLSLLEGYPVPPNLGRLLHQWRHGRVMLWMDTQHVRDVSKRALNACGWLYLHATTSTRDLRWLREKAGGDHGAELVAALRECAERMARRGEPGWHVVLDGYLPLPPFTLRRE